MNKQPFTEITTINDKTLKKGHLNLFFENSKILLKEKKFYISCVTS